MMSKPNEQREACVPPPLPPPPHTPKNPCETQDSLFLRHLLSIILHFLFIFPLQPNGLLADWSALDVDFGQLVERDRRRKDSLCAFTYYLAQLITGRITCVGGQCVSALGLCQQFRIVGRKKEKLNPRGIKICFASHCWKKKDWPNRRKSGRLGLDQKNHHKS